MNKEPEMNNLRLPQVEPMSESADEASSEPIENACEPAENACEVDELPDKSPESQDDGETPENAPEEKKKQRKDGLLNALKSLFDYVEILGVAILAVLLIFTFCFRLCKVDGNSMNNTLGHGELLITTNIFYEPQHGDIIVFHLSNDYYEQPLVKRVIAKEGQRVEIDFVSGEVKVDGTTLYEEYIYLDGGEYDIRAEFDHQYLLKDEEGRVIGFDATVPEGHVFAMGDNRNHSTDSRAVSVGFVDEDCILGKALVRLSPFTIFN